MSFKKSLLLLCLFTGFFPLPAYVRTPIEIEDVYIWGVDLSGVEGIKREDRLLYPVLIKSDFIDPYSGDLFLKGDPRTLVEPSDGLRVYGGAGNLTDYLFGLSQ